MFVGVLSTYWSLGKIMKVLKYKCDETKTLFHIYIDEAISTMPAGKSHAYIFLLNFKFHFKKVWHPHESAVSMKISNSRHELHLCVIISVFIIKNTSQG